MDNLETAKFYQINNKKENSSREKYIGITKQKIKKIIIEYKNDSKYRKQKYDINKIELWKPGHRV